MEGMVAQVGGEEDTKVSVRGIARRCEMEWFYATIFSYIPLSGGFL